LSSLLKIDNYFRYVIHTLRIIAITWWGISQRFKSWR